MNKLDYELLARPVVNELKEGKCYGIFDGIEEFKAACGLVNRGLIEFELVDADCYVGRYVPAKKA